jgi:rSAM/selenodomain-associated transferase 2
MKRLGIVVPIYNEGEQLLPWLQQVVSYLRDNDRLVIVDASDGSNESNASEIAPTETLKDFIANHQALHYLGADKGRAVQMNAGAEYLLTLDAYKPELLWFLHSDSGLSKHHLNYLHRFDLLPVWGRFDVQLSPRSFPSIIISAFINIRSRLTQVMTGDQGIFIRADIFQQLGGYANIPLMEDIEISKRLKVLAKADCSGPILKTSARRWQKYGWIKTVLLMWQLRFMYWRGVSADKLVKKYYGN